MLKLVVFATDLKFLDWTRLFDTELITPSKKRGLRFVYDRYRQPSRIKSLTKKADVVFADFLNQPAIKVSQHSSKPIYIRIHRFELDMPELFEQVNWSNVAGVIGVSEYYGKLLRSLVPKDIPIHVIPPGIAAEKWQFKPSETGKLCTWAIPTPRKRIYDLMLALRDETLYVGGWSAKDRILKDINERFALGHILEPDIEFPDWLWDKEIYIHHALDESFGVAIGEAMLAGLIPLVHHLPCVLEYLPRNLTYIYNSELIELIHSVREMALEERLALKQKLREIILDGYTSEQTGLMMEKVFETGHT